MQGTLDLLILKALSLGPMHGWGISNRIQQLSQDAFRIGQGSLYPALHRFESRDWVASLWRTTENNRIARYYELTAAGRRALDEEIAGWRSYTGAVDLVIDAL
jgi:PadR family transcriptional regulator PadR